MADTLRVCWRNLINGEFDSHPLERWTELHKINLNFGMQLYRDTFGGAVHISGTAENGRLTVWDAQENVVLDNFWRTMNVDDLLEEKMRGSTSTGSMLTHAADT